MQKNVRKILSGLLAVTMLSFVAVPAFAAGGFGGGSYIYCVQAGKLKKNQINYPYYNSFYLDWEPSLSKKPPPLSIA